MKKVRSLIYIGFLAKPYAYRGLRTKSFWVQFQPASAIRLPEYPMGTESVFKSIKNWKELVSVARQMSGAEEFVNPDRKVCGSTEIQIARLILGIDFSRQSFRSMDPRFIEGK